MKLKLLAESTDYGSRYYAILQKLRNLQSKIQELQKELTGFPDLKDLESDKDPTMGAYWIKKSLKKLKAREQKLRNQLDELGELWELTRNKVGG